jgi:hypothetical protein
MTIMSNISSGCFQQELIYQPGANCFPIDYLRICGLDGDVLCHHGRVSISMAWF